jgi:hypothetical protein
VQPEHVRANERDVRKVAAKVVCFAQHLGYDRRFELCDERVEAAGRERGRAVARAPKVEGEGLDAGGLEEAPAGVLAARERAQALRKLGAAHGILGQLAQRPGQRRLRPLELGRVHGSGLEQALGP